MTMPQETVVYDVHDFKVYAQLTDPAGAAATYGPAIDVPGVAQVGLDPNFVTAVLKGDAKIIARKGRVDQFNFSATYGKLSLPVLKVIIGGTVTAATTVSAKYKLQGKNSLPYFKCAFAIDDLDGGLGSLHVIGFKGQLTGGTLLGGSSDNFGQPTMQIGCIPTDGNDDFLDVELYSAQTPLPV